MLYYVKLLWNNTQSHCAINLILYILNYVNDDDVIFNNNPASLFQKHRIPSQIIFTNDNFSDAKFYTLLIIYIRGLKIKNKKMSIVVCDIEHSEIKGI